MTSPDPLDTLAIANRIVYELTGRRWVWPAVTTTETIDLYAGQQVIVLHGRPVRNVASVVIEDEPDYVLEWTLESKHRIRIKNRLSYRKCGRARAVSVTYTYGSPPPLQLQTAIDVLAGELQLAYDQDGACRLPDHVTSITRQGVSMTVVDPESFVDNGLTGISEVDDAIRLFNMSRAKRPARVYGTVTPPPRRTNTTQATT